MKPFPLIISYYTVGTVYEKIAEDYLLDSLSRIPLPHIIKPEKNRGNWRKNAVLKPSVIKHFLDNSERDLIWVDADATIEQKPVLLYHIPEEYDMALHWLDWELHYGRKGDAGKSELISGTIFIRNNKKMKDFLTLWCEETDKRAFSFSTLEQGVLEQLIKKSDLKIMDLPRGYCYINSLPNGHPPAVEIKHPIIVHHQVSREYKKLKEL